MEHHADRTPADREASVSTQLAAFRERCRAAGTWDAAEDDLHAWSVRHYRDFWRLFLDEADLAWEGSADVVCTSDDVERAVFFPDVRLNYAENLLRPLPSVDEAAPAVTSVHGDGTSENITRAQLRARVQVAATRLAARGVGTGDRVVLIAPNSARPVVVGLAVAALGGAVSTGMPEMGPAALLGRFEQVEPALLVLDRTGSGDWAGTAGDTLCTLLEGLPSVRDVLLLDDGPLPSLPGRRVERLCTEDETVGGELEPWPRLPFNQPLFVMFSSGTTGPPKAMVHGAGGTLLEHVKEHRLHGDLRPGDTLYFHTTTAWMMWNWQLSALAVGARIVLYDGPVLGPETLWHLVADQGVTVFGTSPAYLKLCQDTGYRPAADVDLSRLRVVMSTGAVLHDFQFDWFAEAVGPLPLQSISGGTDLIGCFTLGHPERPVHRGRCQSRSLGLDVAAVDGAGTEVVGEVGDLVCRNPFPSRPVHFLRDPDGHRFHDAYFADHPGMWTHGDLIDIAADGSVRMHGRADGVLNIDGVRIGPSEIYDVLRTLPEIADAMAVEQRDADTGSSRLALLLVLQPGARFDADLAALIRTTLLRQASAAHVPSLILPVDELPLTHSGKRSERAARDVLNGEPVANQDALKNPGSLLGIAQALVAELSAAPHVPVRTPVDGDETEFVLRQLWQEALGPAAVAEADVGRSFTELGGTSRQAMTLIRQVRTVLGRDVPMEAFLTDPTLAGLEAAARGATGIEDAPAVVPLAPGRRGDTPLFLLPDAWGDVDLYCPLALLLTDTGPVQGVRVELTRPDGGGRSIVEVAADCAEAVQRAAPEGQLRLGGFSFGGLVAYEVARLLSDAGRDVDLLVMFDVLPPAGGLNRVERLLSGGATRAALLAPSMREETLGELLRARFRPGTLDPDGQLFLRSNGVYHRHRPGPYTGPVLYFRARRRIPVVQHLMHTWRRVAPDLTVIDVHGAHHEILGQVHVAELARTLSRELAGRSGDGARIPPASDRGAA